MLFLVNKFSTGKYYLELKTHFVVSFLVGQDKCIPTIQAICKSDISNISDSFALHASIKQRHLGSDCGLLL